MPDTNPSSGAGERPSLGRNVTLLAICQGLFQSVQTMGISASPLAGYALLGDDKSLATLPIFLQHAGVMLTTVPASLLMARIGRRAGFTLGAIISIVFGALAAYAIVVRSFPLLCAATLLQGASAAFAWYYRFAAADAAPPAYRAKAISLVMAGGVVAGIVGPQLAKWSVNWFAPLTFVGVYVSVVLVATLSLILTQGVSIPTLSQAERAKGGRPMREIARQPAYMTALTASMFGYGVMTLIMSTTPLAMMACGYTFHDSATVIQAHVVAMFLPAFITGHLITRFGVLPIITAGAAIQLLCAVVNLMGINFWNFLIANSLVGLGWNFCYVGGTTLLTRTYTPVERAKVQASHDFMVYATTATAAGVAGLLQATAGWAMINWAAVPLMLTVITLTLWLRARYGVNGGGS